MVSCVLMREVTMGGVGAVATSTRTDPQPRLRAFGRRSSPGPRWPRAAGLVVVGRVRVIAQGYTRHVVHGDGRGAL